MTLGRQIASSIVIVSLAVAAHQLGPTAAAAADQRPGRAAFTPKGAEPQYYYTRTRSHPSHLRVAEATKNRYVDEVRLASAINGTTYEYYKSASLMGYDELVFETIDKMFRHRLSPFYIHHYDREEDKRRSGDPRRVSQEACARDLLYLVDKLPKRGLHRNPFAGLEPSGPADEEPLTPELTAFFDSYARQEAGLLRGNTYWVGSHDQCVSRDIFELVDSAPGAGREPKQQVVAFGGRYCVAALKSPRWNRMIENKKRSARDYFKSERQLADYGQLFRLQLGICLPDSCDSTAAERHLDEIKLLAKSTLEPRFADYELADLYCLPDEASPLRQWSSSALAFLAVVSLWLAAVLAATLADVLAIFEDEPARPAGQRVRLFLRLFSLRANYRKLMQVSAGDDGEAGEPAQQRQESAGPTGEPQAPQLRIDLRFLNAFKALIMFWIINGHIMLLMIQTAKNILDSDALLNGLMHFLIGATFGVDLFFTMTGFLTAYLMFSSGHAFKMKPASWLYLSFHRYWRLAPMYLLAFWFSRSVVQLLGAGPLWDYGTSRVTFRGLCNTESWWFPATLTSNLHGLFEECMITSWYISCDMQFWLVSPVFIHLLARSPQHGWLATVVAIMTSAKVRFDSILADKSARYDELVQPRADIFMRVSHDLPALYTHPHHRIAAYLVGLLAGHYVYMIKSGKWTSVLTADLAARQQPADEKAAACPPGAASPHGGPPAAEGAPRRKNDNGHQPQVAEMTLLGKPSSKTTTTTTTKRTATPAETRARSSRRARGALALTGLALFAIMASCSYLLHHYFPRAGLKHARPIAALFYALDHLAMSTGASLVIVTMCLGQWAGLARFLSHPNWTRLSKINYALLLLQCEAIYFQIFRYEQVPLAGTRELINILFNLLVTLYPLAFLATLVFEFPLANLEKVVMSRLLSKGGGGGDRTKTRSAPATPPAKAATAAR